MSELQKINQTSNIAVYRAIKGQSVKEMLRKLNLKSSFFAVLVNGRRVMLNKEIEKNDEIVDIPKISGG